MSKLCQDAVWSSGWWPGHPSSVKFGPQYSTALCDPDGGAWSGASSHNMKGSFSAASTV